MKSQLFSVKFELYEVEKRCDQSSVNVLFARNLELNMLKFILQHYLMRKKGMHILYVWKMDESVGFIFFTAVYNVLHLELVTSLSNEAFLNALRQFISKGGRPTLIYSDNGTNFSGAKTLLRNVNWDIIKNTLPSTKLSVASTLHLHHGKVDGKMYGPQGKGPSAKGPVCRTKS